MPPVASLLATPGQSFEDAKKHWAYQPITNLSPPMVKNSSRVQSPIDAFLLEKLEAQNLTFAPPADKRTLRRRVFYDLIGLPPPPEEIRAFEREGSRNAFAKVADRLLASPGYGERWGRHWLAAARYAATKDPVLACGQDALRPFAYTYRDYVIHLPEPFEPYIFKRGNSSRLGQAVPRAFLTVLSDGQPVPFAHGSGRLELAHTLISPANPLTTRVFVQRVWRHYFGEPFTNSTTDFGARNEPPAKVALSTERQRGLMSTATVLKAELPSSTWSGKSRPTEHRTLNTLSLQRRRL